MEIITSNIRANIGDIVNITPIGDIHHDASASDKAMFNRVIEERMSLPNSYFIGLGDFYEFIMSDDHRYTRGNDGMPPGNNPIDKVVKDAIKRFSGPKWLAMCCGNHCLKIAHKYHTDPMERISDGLGAPYSRYAGRLIIRFREPDGGSHCSLRILFHHGAWGGDASAGFSGAMRWARSQSGWDLCLWGHNHQSMVRSYDVVEQSPSGRIIHHPQHAVACGTFLRGDAAGLTTYSEKAGYGPVFVGCPLIRARVCRDGIAKIKVEVGEPW